MAINLRITLWQKIPFWTKTMQASGRWTHLLQKVSIGSFKVKRIKFWSFNERDREREREHQDTNRDFTRSFTKGIIERHTNQTLGIASLHKIWTTCSLQIINIYIYIYIKQQKHKTVGQLAKLDQRKCKTNLHGHNPLRAVWSINPNPGALPEKYQESHKEISPLKDNNYTCKIFSTHSNHKPLVDQHMWAYRLSTRCS